MPLRAEEEHQTEKYVPVAGVVGTALAYLYVGR